MTNAQGIPDGISDQRSLWAVAAAVEAAVVSHLDHRFPDPDMECEVVDTAAAKQYVESFLDGYAVSDESLQAAIAEGPAISEDTLKELISQAAVSGIDNEEFFDPDTSDVDIAAGLRAASRYGGDSADRENGAQHATTRDELFAALQVPEEAGDWLFIEPELTNMSEIHAAVADYLVGNGLPTSTPYIGWPANHDAFEPEGSLTPDNDFQRVFWWGDGERIRELLRNAVEPLGFVVEGGENHTAFRLVPAENAATGEPFILPARDDFAPTQPGSTYRYSSSWSEKERQPDSGSELTEDEARERYSWSGTQKEFFVFPDAENRDLPAWSMRIHQGKSAQVSHYQADSGSAARIVEFGFSSVGMNGRFFRSEVTDFLWPEQHSSYAPTSEATTIVTLRSGTQTSETIVEDRANGQIKRFLHRDVPGAHWVSAPQFGQWEPLLDPWFGEADDPTAVERTRYDEMWLEAAEKVWDSIR